MLALTRIVAAQGAQGASPPKADPGKAAIVQDNPFTRLLAAAERGRGASRAGADGAVASRGARAALRAAPAHAAVAGRNAAERSGSGNAATPNVDAATRAKAAAAKRGADGANGPAAKTPDGTPASNAAAKRRAAAGDASPARDNASVLAASAAQSASGTLAAKPVQVQANGVSDRQRAGGENGSSGIETVGIGTERRADGAKVTVVDLRLKANRGAASRREAGDAGEERGGLTSAAKPSGGADSANPGVPIGGPLSDPAETVSQPREGLSAPTQPTAEGLASRLREGAADIVRSAQVVLRGGDSGVIRLRLEPESLGGVKIELKMAEKQISGKIVVESDIAGEAFRSSLDSLKDAFAECGFETSALEVEVRNDMASGHGDGQAGGERDEGPYWSRSLRELDAAVPRLAGAGRDGLLDVVV